MREYIVPVLKKNRWILILIPFIFVGVTAIVVYQIPKQYEATITWIQPSSVDAQKKMPNIAALMGLGGSDGGQEPLMEIMTSTVFLEPLLQEKVQTTKGPISLANFFLGGKALDPKTLPPWANYEEVRRSMVIDKIRKVIKVQPGAVNKITILTEDPLVTKELSNKILSQLVLYRNIMHLDKAAQDRVFLEGRHAEYAQKLQNAENSLMSFSMQNRDLSSPALALQSQRLRREVDAYNALYLETQNQLEAARINEKVQEQKPILLCPPETPLWSEYPKKKIILPVALFVGLFFSLLWYTFALWRISSRKVVGVDA